MDKGAIWIGTASLFPNFISLFERPRKRLIKKSKVKISSSTIANNLSRSWTGSVGPAPVQISGCCLGRALSWWCDGLMWVLDYSALTLRLSCFGVCWKKGRRTWKVSRNWMQWSACAGVDEDDYYITRNSNLVPLIKLSVVRILGGRSCIVIPSLPSWVYYRLTGPSFDAL